MTVDWSGCANHRDVGGAPTATGARVRTGALVRSGRHDRLSAAAVEAVRALKAGEGKPIALNGAGLAESLAPGGVIDEYLLFVHPVLLGGGTRLFPAGAPRVPLRLLDTQTYPAGVTRLHYAVAR